MTNVLPSTTGRDKYIGTKGDDIVYGSTGNDDFKLGTGSDAIFYSGINFGNDTINLTKDEKLNLAFTSYKDLNYSISGNDLVINAQTSWSTVNNTITLKNFAKSNVVGLNGDVTINGSESLKDILADNMCEFDKDSFDKKGRFSTYWFNEGNDVEIDASEVARNTTITSKAAYSEITGSNYNDTINVTGAVRITEEKGKNKITVKSDGSNYGYYNLAGTSNNTIKAGDFYNSYRVEDNSVNKITGGSGTDVAYFYGGTNYINTGAGSDRIKVLDNYSDNEIYTGTGFDSVILEVGNNEVTLGCDKNDIKNAGDSYINFVEASGNSNNIINGSIGDDRYYLSGSSINYINDQKGNNYFNIDNGYNEIVTGSGNDVFNISYYAKETNISSGAGNDIFYFDGDYYYSKTKEECVVDGGKGNDIYVFESKCKFDKDTVSITDTAGKNKIVVAGAEGKNLFESRITNDSSWGLYFDVTLDKKGNGVADLSNIIISKDYKSNPTNFEDFETGIQLTTSVKKTNELFKGFSFTDSDGKSLNVKMDQMKADIASIANNVASWLSHNGYDSVIEACENNEYDLLQYFTASNTYDL